MNKSLLLYVRFLVTAIIFPLSFWAIAQTPDAHGIVYVTTTGTGNGSSWANATDNLQGAINTTGAQKVFVATGNYNVGSSSFIMKNEVEIYGGFDPVNNTTDWDTRTLPNKGTGNGSVLNGKNERPVIWNYNNGVTTTAILDGFTITSGFNTANSAGIMNTGTSPTLRNLLITGNHTNAGGAGIYNSNASPVVTNVVIKENTAGTIGGGIANTGASSPVLTNVLLTANTAGTNGGGVSHTGTGNARLNNTTIADNTPDAIIINSGGLVMNNTIVYGTITGVYTAQYSLIESNSNTDNGNIDAIEITVTDIFTDAANGDYTLWESSPAIDAGNNALFAGLEANTNDLAGNPRVYNSGIIDLGAYEYQGLKVITSVAAQKNKSLSIQVYPNPATEQITISNLTGDEIITIYNQRGTAVIRQKSGGPQTFIPLDTMSGGVYHISVMSDNGSIASQKLILVK